MKVIRFSMIIHFLILACLTDGPFAQDYTQFNLPEDAKRRLGKGKIVDMAYAPDGKQLAVATSIGIWIYDSQTGREVDMLQGHMHRITCIAYAPDGRTLVSGSTGRDDAIILWDMVSGTRQATLTVPIGVYSVAFSPDGKTFATGGYEEVRLWDAVSWERKVSFKAEVNFIIDNLAFSPDGKTIATVGTSAEDIRLWDVATATRKATLQGHASWVQSLTFSPDGGTLASGSWDSTIRLWDITAGAHKATFADPRIRSAPFSLAFSPDGRTLAHVGSKDVVLWDVPSGQVRKILTGHTSRIIENLAFSPDGKTIATGNGEIRLWDVVSGEHKKTFGDHMEPVTNVAFSPDGSTLAGSEGNRIHVWEGGRVLKTTLIGHTDIVTSIAFSPDGKTIASSSEDATVRVWDVVSGVQKTAFLGHWGVVNSVAFSPDGQILVSGGWDKTVRLWDIVHGTHKTTLTGHTEGVNSVAFSPDGKTLATGSRDKTVRLWDARSGQHRQTLTGPIEGIYRVAFSPDGKTLAVGTEAFGLAEMWLWDAAAGEYKAVKKGFSNAVTFAFSPDGKTFATTSKEDDAVILWDAATGVLKTTFSWYSHSFAFSPDGKTLATGGTQDGFILLWELAPDLLQPAEQTSVLLPPLPESPPRVRLVYFFPNDHTPPSNIDAKLRTLIKETQRFYADQMASHGFGRKTFLFETDSNGNAVVHHMQGNGSTETYISRTLNCSNELRDRLDITVEHIYLVALDERLQGALPGACGIAFLGTGVANRRRSDSVSPSFAYRMSTEGRYAIVYASGHCAGVRVTAHELGHTFGLSHDYREKDYVMIGHNTPETPRFSYAAAEWLNVHPFLNAGQPNNSENHTTIEILSPRASQLQFQIADTDGLHQAQLILTENVTNDVFCGSTASLQHFQALNGTSDITFGFAATSASTEVSVRVIDMHGNIAYRSFWIEPDDSIQGVVSTPDTTVPGDVNEDGVVDPIDLLLVAKAHGENPPANPRIDVNSDGIVDVEDILLVADAIELDAGAPSLHPIALELFTPSAVQQWLRDARQMDVTQPTLQRGILVLEQLLAVLVPKDTVLLANYPDPFNPETWIPYQLSEPAEVTVAIHAADGQLVRTIALGHQPAGVYENKNRAAYWDGRNNVGERVASGVYFYTLKAGEFAATQKMLILK